MGKPTVKKVGGKKSATSGAQCGTGLEKTEDMAVTSRSLRPRPASGKTTTLPSKTSGLASSSDKTSSAKPCGNTENGHLGSTKVSTSKDVLVKRLKANASLGDLPTDTSSKKHQVCSLNTESVEDERMPLSVNQPLLCVQKKRTQACVKSSQGKKTRGSKSRLVHTDISVSRKTEGNVLNEMSGNEEMASGDKVTTSSQQNELLPSFSGEGEENVVSNQKRRGADTAQSAEPSTSRRITRATSKSKIVQKGSKKTSTKQLPVNMYATTISPSKTFHDTYEQYLLSNSPETKAKTANPKTKIPTSNSIPASLNEVVSQSERSDSKVHAVEEWELNGKIGTKTSSYLVSNSKSSSSEESSLMSIPSGKLLSSALKGASSSTETEPCLKSMTKQRKKTKSIKKANICNSPKSSEQLSSVPCLAPRVMQRKMSKSSKHGTVCTFSSSSEQLSAEPSMVMQRKKPKSSKIAKVCTSSTSTVACASNTMSPEDDISMGERTKIRLNRGRVNVSDNSVQVDMDAIDEVLHVSVDYDSNERIVNCVAGSESCSENVNDDSRNHFVIAALAKQKLNSLCKADTNDKIMWTSAPVTMRINPTCLFQNATKGRCELSSDISSTASSESCEVQKQVESPFHSHISVPLNEDFDQKLPVLAPILQNKRTYSKQREVHPTGKICSPKRKQMAIVQESKKLKLGPDTESEDKSGVDHQEMSTFKETKSTSSVQHLPLKTTLVKEHTVKEETNTSNLDSMAESKNRGHQIGISTKSSDSSHFHKHMDTSALHLSDRHSNIGRSDSPPNDDGKRVLRSRAQKPSPGVNTEFTSLVSAHSLLNASSSSAEGTLCDDNVVTTGEIWKDSNNKNSTSIKVITDIREYLTFDDDDGDDDVGFEDLHCEEKPLCEQNNIELPGNSCLCLQGCSGVCLSNVCNTGSKEVDVKSTNNTCPSLGRSIDLEDLSLCSSKDLQTHVQEYPSISKRSPGNVTSRSPSMSKRKRSCDTTDPPNLQDDLRKTQKSDSSASNPSPGTIGSIPTKAARKWHSSNPAPTYPSSRMDPAESESKYSHLKGALSSPYPSYPILGKALAETEGKCPDLEDAYSRVADEGSSFCITRDDGKLANVVTYSSSSEDHTTVSGDRYTASAGGIPDSAQTTRNGQHQTGSEQSRSEDDCLKNVKTHSKDAPSLPRGPYGWEECLRKQPSKTQLYQAGIQAADSPRRVNRASKSHGEGSDDHVPSSGSSGESDLAKKKSPASRQSGNQNDLAKAKTSTPKKSTMISPFGKKSGDSYKSKLPEAVVLEDDDELESVVELEPNYGKVVWARLSGERWWPSLVIKGKLINLQSEKTASSWVYWFGDHKVSLVAHDKIIPFCENYASKLGNFKSKVYRKAVLEVLAECGRRSDIGASLDSDAKLLQWAETGFLGNAPGEKTNMEPNKDNPIHESVMAYLREIGADIRNKAAKIDFRNNHKEEYTESAVDSVRKGLKDIKDVCIGCSDLDQEVVCQHPLFTGGLCQKCQNEVTETMFAIGDDGLHSFCAVCGSGGDLFVCDTSECKRVYCRPCVGELGGETVLNEVISAKRWHCFLCSPADSQSACLLFPRLNWQENIIMFFDSGYRVQVPSLDYFKTKRSLRVLSLYDGIGSGKLTLNNLGLKVDQYYASEIDKDALIVTLCNHGAAVNQVGDVTKLLYKQLKEMAPIDLLIGGSPCNDLSLANPARRGFQYGSSALLFFEYVRIRDKLQTLNTGTHLFWLYENVASMKTEFKNTISRFLECQPALWDSKYMSAQQRGRYFWGNIPGMYSTPAVSTHLHEDVNLDSVLAPNCNRRATIKKMGCVTTRTNSLKHGKNDQLFPVEMLGEATGIWIPEVERLFGYPSHYTDVGNLPPTRRQKLLGKSWSIPVMEVLLAPLKQYFATEDFHDNVQEGPEPTKDATKELSSNQEPTKDATKESCKSPESTENGTKESFSNQEPTNDAIRESCRNPEFTLDETKESFSDQESTKDATMESHCKTPNINATFTVSEDDLNTTFTVSEDVAS